jgi:hypothetical protein
MNDKIIKLEHDIASFINKDNGATVHFEYATSPSINEQVSAYTINATTKEPFLLKWASGKTKEEALEIVLAYIKEQKGMNSFTVVWTKIGINKTETSYFYCHDILDVVSKFFNKKDSADYVIYEIKMNPIS